MTKRRRGAYPVTITRVEPATPKPSPRLIEALIDDGHDPSSVTVIRPGLVEVTVR